MGNKPKSVNKTLKQPQQEKSFFKSKKVLIIAIVVVIICVVLFIALLSTIAFVSLDDASDSADDFRKISELRVLDTALLGYFVQNGNYPTVNGVASGECGNISVLYTDLSSSLPRFDFNDSDYFYCVDNPQNSEAYILGVQLSGSNSILENDIDGNAGSPFTIQGEDSREKCGITSSDTVYCVGGGTSSRPGTGVGVGTPSIGIDGNFNLDGFEGNL